MGIGGAALGAGLLLQRPRVQGAGSARSSSPRLSTQHRAQSYDDYAAKIEEAVKHQEKFGNTAADTKQALQILTQATHDPQKAWTMLGDGQRPGCGQARVATVGRRTAGQGVQRQQAASSKSSGIRPTPWATRSRAGKRRIDLLSKSLAGQASASADTFGGKLKDIKATRRVECLGLRSEVRARDHRGRCRHDRLRRGARGRQGGDVGARQRDQDRHGLPSGASTWSWTPTPSCSSSSPWRRWWPG